MNTDEDRLRNEDCRRQGGGGTPHIFCKCSFQETLSPMILELRIPKGLQGRFSDVRILKGLRAQTWDTGSRWSSRSLRRNTASRYRVSPFCKALGKLCTSCYLAGNCRQRETELRQRKRAKLAFERDSRHPWRDEQACTGTACRAPTQGLVARVSSPGFFADNAPGARVNTTAPP